MFKIPNKQTIFELVEKRSRFITYCEAVNNEQEFKQFLNRLKLQYPDARHFCYGFRMGPISSAHRGFSDDGEPSGTAGMPILNVIDHSEFSNLAVIVVRYFGGTKLGTGGLARAYSQATKSILEKINWKIYQPQIILTLRCQFQHESQLRYLIDKLEGEIVSVKYEQEVEFEVSLSDNLDLSSLKFYRASEK